MKKKQRRGFAAMDPEKRRQIASLGGKAAQRRGAGHQWDEAEARQAGAKGGRVTEERGTGNRFDSESGAEAARKRRRR